MKINVQILLTQMEKHLFQNDEWYMCVLLGMICEVFVI